MAEDLVALLKLDLVTANHILSHENIVDAFGHISVRHPHDPGRFFLSRARTPECIELDDIMEFTLDGTPIDANGRVPYLERYIHAALFEMRPDVNSAIHSHSSATIPFSVCDTPIRPLLHNTSAIGEIVRIWDSQTNFGDTDLLVPNMEMARDFAAFLGGDPCALMRGHGSTVVAGSIRSAVYTAIALETAAKLQSQAQSFGNVTFLTSGEVQKVNAMFKAIEDKPLAGTDRAWEYWCRRAGEEYRPMPSMAKAS